jgi:hypothetical protein
MDIIYLGPTDASCFLVGQFGDDFKFMENLIEILFHGKSHRDPLSWKVS